MESRVNNKYSHLPAGWEVKTVEQVFDFYPTASYSRDKMFKDNNPSAIGYIHYGDIHTKYNLILDVPNTEIPYISEELKKDFEYIKEGDLILSDTSEDYDGVGKCIEILNVGSNKIISGLHTLILRPKGNDLIDGFKGYLFSGEYVRNSLLRIVTGIKVYSIAKAMLAKVNLPIPSIQEQKEITSVLSKVDKAIASVQNSIAAAERLKKSLMQNLLTGKMKPNGTFRTPDEFYIDEKFGKVPVGWEVKSIDEISDFVQYGLNISSSDNGQIPMLRMNNIVNGEMSDSPLVYVNLNDQLLQQYELEAGDILFNRTNSMDLVGKVGVFRLMGKYVFASYLIRVRVSKENNPYYINLALNSYPIQCSLRSKATPAVSQANINSKSLRHTQIFKPKKKDEQDLVMSKIEEVEHVILQKNDKVKKLEQLKKSLMQNLLTGKIKIDKDI